VRRGLYQIHSFRKEHIMQVQSYLFFDGRCEEALEFYKKAVGDRSTC